MPCAVHTAAIMPGLPATCAPVKAGWTADDQTIFDHVWGRAVPGSRDGSFAPANFQSNLCPSHNRGHRLTENLQAQMFQPKGDID